MRDATKGGGLRRREFLRVAIAGAATLSTPLPLLAFDPARYDRPWMPSQAFLDELPEWMRAFGVPGVGIAVVEAGSVTWTRSVGIADPATGRPVEEGSLFECASLSKPVFACLVLQLIDQGRIGLDDRLITHLRPDYLDPADARLEAITVLDVLRHTSGLPNWRAHPDREPLRTIGEPGRELHYSGEAFYWLQCVVESICGAGLDRLMQQHLFADAGMQRSTYTWTPLAARDSVVGTPAPGEDAPVQTFREQWPIAQRIAEQENTSLADWRWTDGVRALPKARAQSPEGMFVWPGDLLANSAASLRAPVSDYARFLIWAMAGEKAAHGLREKTRAAMFSAQFPVSRTGIDKGLGWNLESIDARERWCFHGGANAGRYKTFVVGDPLRHRGIVVMTNSGNGTPIYQRIVRNAIGRDMLAFDL